MILSMKVNCKLDFGIFQRQKMKEEIEVLQENLVRSDEHLHYKEIEFDKALQNIHWERNILFVSGFCK